MDNDMLGMAQRVLAGIEVNEETLSVDVIRNVALGVGHYLGQDQTIARMETEYLYPDLADRNAPGVWQAEGAKDMLARAQERARATLKSHYPTHIDKQTDAAIRAKFPILLAEKDMRKGNGRW